MEAVRDTGRQPVRVIIAGDAPEALEQVRTLLEQSLLPLEVVGATDTRGCLALVRDQSPDVVLALDREANVPAVEISRQIYQSAPGTATIVLAAEDRADDGDYLRRAMQNKASDVLAEKPLLDALARSIQAAASLEGRRPAARRVPRPAQAVGGRLIVFHGPKGGVGKSFLASNLAVLVAKEHPQLGVAMLDLDLRFGDQAVLLDLERERSAMDLLSVIGELTPDALEAAVTRHGSGLEVLLPPPEPQQADLFGETSVREILLAMKRDYDMVFVDTSSELSDVTLTALELADQILLVLTPDVLSVWKSRGLIQLGEELGIPTEIFKVLVNRTSKKSEVKAQDLKALFDCEILAEVPADFYAVQPFVNTGVPFVEAQRKGPIVESLQEIGSSLVDSLERGR